MKRDIRDTDLYREAEALCISLRQPGTGQISDAAELHVSPDGRLAVFAGTIVDELEGGLQTRICLTDLHTGDTRVLTFGPNIDRLPKFSPDGRRIAFLSDRHQPGDFQLHLLDPNSGAAQAAARAAGWIEYLHWSPDGTRILLGVAGHGADISGGQGAITSKRADESQPGWMPLVESGNESHRWRHAWIYSVADGRLDRAGPSDMNCWEAVWCGNHAVAAVMSPGPEEGLWYSARLHVIDLESGDCRPVYEPRDQLGWPAASPSGRYLAFVEAVCSDRWIVAGGLRILDRSSGKLQRVPASGIDISYAEWRSEQKLLLGGHRGLETVLALYDVAKGELGESWASKELTGSGRYVTASGFNEAGDCALIAEGFMRSPEIAVIRNRQYQAVKSFELGYAGHAQAIRSMLPLTWQAPDGLEIQGWLLRPAGDGPHPLVMLIHGGPLWHWRTVWLGRGVQTLMLIKKGYAVFLPNPRGSTGRGYDFARRVRADMGGGETLDNLSGLDYLVKEGFADASRLGVTGGSHGGFMTSWLVTQDSRFAAAVAVAPVTNYVTAELISNIPQFTRMFLDDSYDNAAGNYFSRSPVMHAGKVRTPTLNICGALDRCTPPEEAVQFHNALLANGVESVLVTYPEEGHGVRRFPAALDYAARVVGWFEEHMSAGMRPADADGVIQERS